MLSAERLALGTGPRHSPQRRGDAARPQAGGSHLDYTLSERPERGRAAAARPPSQTLGPHSSLILSGRRVSERRSGAVKLELKPSSPLHSQDPGENSGCFQGN